MKKRPALSVLSALSFGIFSSCSFLLFFLLSSLQANAGRADTVLVHSNAMHKDIKCVVIRPSRYRPSGKPVSAVYLLHGWSGSYAQWPSLAPQLKAKADEFNILIICPDGGYDSWYFDSPVDSSVRYETFISGELVSFIDAHYHTFADRRHRAITGLSMGGHGGLFLGIRHKDLYGAAGAMSGGVDFRPFPDSWGLKKDLGDSACCQASWENNTVIHAVDNLRNKELKIIFDCGVDDFFLEVNRNLHRLLVDRKIEHDYTERPGGHNNNYWRNSVDFQLLFFAKYFREE